MSETPPTNPTGEPTPGTLRFLKGTGHFLLVASLTFFTALTIYDWDNPNSPYKHTFELIAAHFAFGRMGNAAIGGEVGFPKLILVYQCFVQDLIIMCYLYPLFVKGYTKVGRIPLIGHYLEDAHKAAVEHKHKIAPFGILGLLFFVMLPIWSTGPLVGVFVGYLIGMGTLLTFSTVIIADLVMTFAYVYAFTFIQDKSPTLSRGILYAVIAIAVGAFLYRQIRKRMVKTPALTMENATPPETAPDTEV